MALTVSKKIPSHEYTPYDQRGEEVDKPVVLTIRPLTKKQLAALDDGLTKIFQDNSIALQHGSYNYEAARIALQGWTNINDENGKPMVITKVGNLVVDESLNLLPAEWITEIANVVIAITKAPEDTELFLGNVGTDETSEE